MCFRMSCAFEHTYGADVDFGNSQFDTLLSQCAQHREEIQMEKIVFTSRCIETKHQAERRIQKTKTSNIIYLHALLTAHTLETNL